jgi:hypothetical protein
MMNIFGIRSGSTITINGVEYTGNNIVINNGNVTIDGKHQSQFINQPTIIIQVFGDVGSIQSSSGDVSVRGTVSGGITTASGDIECGDVTGSVKTVSGDILCGEISGNVSTVSGDIHT